MASMGVYRGLSHATGEVYAGLPCDTFILANFIRKLLYHSVMRIAIGNFWAH